MNTFKRVLAWIVIVIAALGIIICVVGAVGAWIINNRLSDISTNILATAEQVFQNSGERLDRLDNALGLATEALTTVEDGVANLRTGIIDGNPILNLLSRVVSEELKGKISSAYESAKSLKETLQTLGAIVQGIDALPFVDLPRIKQVMDDVSDGLSSILTLVEDLNSMVDQLKSDLTSQLLDPIAELAGRIRVEVEGAQAQVQVLRQQVAELEALAVALREKVPTIFLILSIAETILLLWLALAQGALMVLSRNYIKHGVITWKQVPATEGGTQLHAAPEVVEETSPDIIAAEEEPDVNDSLGG